jgi:hypothetical protein
MSFHSSRLARCVKINIDKAAPNHTDEAQSFEKGEIKKGNGK